MGGKLAGVLGPQTMDKGTGQDFFFTPAMLFSLLKFKF